MALKKSTFFLLLLLGFGSFLQAQVNLDFEAWESTNNGTKPTGWTTFDDQLPSSADETVKELSGGDQSEGASAAQLETIDIQSNVIPGFLIQTAEFNKRPTLINLDVQYDIKANDTAHVIAQLLEYDQAGNPSLVGIAGTLIPGSASLQSWESLIRPFQYQNNNTPDSIIFSIRSSRNNAQVGSQLSIDDLGFCRDTSALDSTVTRCGDNSNIDLVSLLGGSPLRGGIGTWIDVDNTNALNGDTLDLSQLGSGNYEFKYVTNLATCTPDTATLTLDLISAPAAGQSDSVLVCANENVDLINKLGGNPDNGGSWQDLDNSGALTNGTLNTANLSFGTNYSFRYTNSGNGCVDSATLTVELTESNAGQDSTILTCESTADFDLFSRLGGNPDKGGTWSDNDTTGALNDSTVDLSQLPEDSSFQFTYEVSTDGCSPDDATLTLETEAPLSPGESNTINACYNDTVDLFASLGGNPETGGTWSDVDNSGALSGSDFDASEAQDSMTYQFEYTLKSQTGCQASSMVTVNVSLKPDAGDDAFGGVVCETTDSIDMMNLLEGDPQPNGTWSDEENTGAVDENTGILDATQLEADSSYDFVYTIADTCGPDASAELTVNVEPSPNAGENSDTVVVCNTDDAIDLFSKLNGNPDEDGSWTDIDGSDGLFPDEGEFDPSAIEDSGVFRFRFRVNGNECDNDEAFVIVKVNDCEGDFIGNAADRVDLDVYPNPAQNRVTFETADKRANEIRVFDATGSLVRQKAFDAEKVSINVNSWGEGLYIYHLTGDKGQMLSVDKFTIER